MKQRLLLVLAFVSLLGSCAKDETESAQKMGEFSLALTSDVSIETRASSLPSVSDFKVQILSVSDGAVLKEWDKYSSMPSTVKFAVGSYIIKAFHGDSTLSAFDMPTFAGQTRFSVAYQDQKNVAIKCTHNQVLASVVYADGFMKYYKDWNVEVSTSDNTALTFKKDESKVGFFPVAPLKAKVTVTRSDDKRLEAVMPAIKDVKAAQHYTINVDVKDGAGGATFNIVEAETNNIVKSVEVPFTAAAALAPYYVAKGFSLEDETSVSLTENKEGFASSMIIKAGGKVKSCIVDVVSPYLISKGIPVKFDLSTTSDNAELKGKLEAIGLKWSPKMKGCTMAEIDFTEFSKNLPADISSSAVHSLTFTTTDDIDGVSPAQKVSFVVKNPTIKINNVVSVTDNDPEQPQSVDAVLNISVVDGLYEEITSVEYKNGLTWVATDKFNISETEGDHNITVNGLPLNQTSYTLRLVHTSKFDTKRYSNEVIAEVIAPEFKIELMSVTDRVAELRVTCTKGDVDFNKLKIDVRNQGIWETENIVLTFDEATNSAVCTLEGLTPSEKYRVRSIYDGRYASVNESLFTTNIFSFESWSSSVINDVQKGSSIWKSVQIWKNGIFGWSKSGKPTESYVTEKTSVDIDNITDNIWTLTSQKTADNSFSNKNSWWIVPSAKKISDANNSGSAVSICSVVWDNDGIEASGAKSPLTVTIPKDPTTPWFKTSPETSEGPQVVPAFDNANMSSGKLFIGEFNGDTPNEKGIKLRSKPLSISFDYRFERCKDDKGVAEIIIYNDDNGAVEIGRGTFDFVENISSWTNKKLGISYDPGKSNLKATRMTVKFMSSKDESLIKSNQYYNVDETNCVAIGNVLDIDELKLNY